MGTFIICFHEEIRKISGPSCSKHRYFNKLIKGHFIKCFSDSVYNILIFFAEKM